MILSLLISFLLEITLFNYRHYELINVRQKNIQVPLDSVIYRNEPLSNSDGIIKNYHREPEENLFYFYSGIDEIRNIKLNTGAASRENPAIGFTITPEELETSNLFVGENLLIPEFDSNPNIRFQSKTQSQKIIVYFGNAINLSYLQITDITLNKEIPLKVNPFRIILLTILVFFIIRFFNNKKIKLNLVHFIKNNSLPENKLIIIVFVFGMILRSCYIIKTPWWEHQHDVLTVDMTQGHAGYILYILTKGVLPEDATAWQFSHPPLHHIISAFYLKILSLLGLLSSSPFDQLQFLTFIYSLLILIILLKILRQIGIEGYSLVIVFSLFCFNPFLIYLSGFLNNDELLLLLILAGLYMALKWNENPSKRFLFLTALFSSFATVTKVSGILLVPAIIILIYLRDSIISKNFKKFVTDGFFFCIVFLPFPMWWFIRCQTVLNIPFNYVADLGKDSGQYLGNYSMFQRLFSVNIKHFQSLFINNSNYNIFVSVLKTSTFGEWIFRRDNIAAILFWNNLFLIIGSIYAMITGIKHITSRYLWISFLYTYYIIQICSFTYFCYKYPQLCTQNFRYIIPTMIIGVCFIGYLFMENQQKTSKINKAINRVLQFSILSFDLTSIIFFVENLL
jgi:hypothetical protein